VERETIDWKSRGSRTKVSLVGIAKCEDGRSFRVLLSNVSYEGCRVWTDHELEVGEKLTVNVTGRGQLPAQVRWVREGSMGLRFLTGLSATDNRRARIGV